MKQALEYEWDDAKASANEAAHGIPFSAVLGFDWQTALVAEDTRRDYGEPRYKALGMIDVRLHVLVFTVRGTRVRVISLFKANEREQRRYENG